MTVLHALVVLLFVVAIVVGVYGIRMERRVKTRAVDRPTYDDAARDLAREQEFTRIRRDHIDSIRAAEVHE